MRLDGLDAQPQPTSDAAIRIALSYGEKHFVLTRRQDAGGLGVVAHQQGGEEKRIVFMRRKPRTWPIMRFN